MRHLQHLQLRTNGLRNRNLVLSVRLTVVYVEIEEICVEKEIPDVTAEDKFNNIKVYN
jgi:hypothetical protein